MFLKKIIIFNFYQNLENSNSKIIFIIIFSKENLPCQNVQFSIVDFDLHDAYIIKAMIELVGGSHVINEVTPKSDIIISSK